MSNPRFAFEWLVLEALTYRGGKDALRGVPGSPKANRAKARGRRLNPASYLIGPRIFGFNGVYRPFCQDSGILRHDGSVGTVADPLLERTIRPLVNPTEMPTCHALSSVGVANEREEGAVSVATVSRLIRECRIKSRKFGPTTVWVKEDSVVRSVEGSLAPTPRYEFVALRRRR